MHIESIACSGGAWAFLPFTARLELLMTALPEVRGLQKRQMGCHPVQERQQVGERARVASVRQFLPSWDMEGGVSFTFQDVL